MRKISVFCLLTVLMLTACAGPGQPLVEVPLPAETALAAQVPATVAPTVAQPAATEAAAPTVLPASLSESVLLVHWVGGTGRVEPVDPATGQALPGYAPVIGEVQAFSAENDLLAAVESQGKICEPYSGGSACRGRAIALHLLDVRNWSDIEAPLLGDGWISPAAFSPDGTRLALAYHRREATSLMLLDAATGEIVVEHAIDFRPSLIAFTQGGTTLAVYGQPLGEEPGITQPDPARLLVVDSSSLEVAWELTFTDLVSGDWCLESCDQQHGQLLFASWTPAVVLSRDATKLFIVHAAEDRLTTVDLAAHTVNDLAIAAKQSWLDRLVALTAGVAQAKGGVEGTSRDAVLSADGARLYVIGHNTEATRPEGELFWQVEQESIGLQVIELATGHILQTADTDAWEIALTPDGKHLLLTEWFATAWTDVVDVNSLERVAQLASWQVAPTQRIDGEPLLLATDPADTSSQVAVVDPTTFEIGQALRVPGYATWLAIP